MSKAFRAGLPALLVLTTLLALPPAPALAISHGCTPPTGDIGEITIEMSLDKRRSRFSGPFCAAIDRAKAAIMSSSLDERRKRGALQTLMQLQDLTASQGRSAAGKKVSGSVGCNGTVTTGSSGTTATGTCGFTINF
jgi:hypothetical protein